MAEILRHPATRRDIIRLVRGPEGALHPRIVEDEVVALGDDDDLPASGRVLVSLWRASGEADALSRRPDGFGVRVPGDTEPEAILEALERDTLDLALIAIEIPKWSDGRHFSLARLLRERHGFAGELRARGDVVPDQLFFMRRCGYDAFELRADKSLATGLRALEAFTVSYQGAADDPRPLWRRR